MCRLIGLCALLCGSGVPLLLAERALVPADGTLEASRDAILEAAEEGDEPVQAMELAGIEPRLASILRRYYERSFGGESNWARIESFRFEGTLRMPQGTLGFRAFKKKPNLCRIVLNSPTGVQIIMSYDGQDAWQLNPLVAPEPVAMSAKEARNFIRDADTGSHLLFPTVPGKTIELLGTRRVGEILCYDLQVTLPNGQVVIYAIDIVEFKEQQQILENAVSGDTEVITHSRHRRIEGIMIPVASTMTIDDEFVHEVNIDRVQINRGVMPWMFER